MGLNGCLMELLMSCFLHGCAAARFLLWYDGMGLVSRSFKVTYGFRALGALFMIHATYSIKHLDCTFLY